MAHSNAVIVSVIAVVAVVLAHAVVLVARRRAEAEGEPEPSMPTAAAIGLSLLALTALVGQLLSAATLAEVLLLLGVSAGVMAALVPLLPAMRRPARPRRVRSGARVVMRHSAVAQGRAAARAVAATARTAPTAASQAHLARKGKPVLPPTPFPHPEHPEHRAPAAPRPAAPPVIAPIRPAAEDAPTEFLPRIVLGDPPPITRTTPAAAMARPGAQADPAEHAADPKQPEQPTQPVIPQPVQQATEALEAVDRVVDDLTGALRLGGLNRVGTDSHYRQFSSGGHGGPAADGFDAAGTPIGGGTPGQFGDTGHPAAYDRVGALGGYVRLGRQGGSEPAAVYADHEGIDPHESRARPEQPREDSDYEAPHWLTKRADPRIDG